MIEENREMLPPGDGIVRDPGPPKDHEEFPRFMRHPAHRRGKPDKEIPLVDETSGRQVGSRFVGGESIRFPDVLAITAADRDYHLSQGYEDKGKSDPAAFRRLAADTAPVEENYKPIEFPKYCFGKVVNDAAEQEAHLIQLGINPDGSPRTASSEAPADEPALVTEVNTLEVFQASVEDDEIAALEAKLAALKAKKSMSDETMTTPDEIIAAVEEEMAIDATQKSVITVIVHAAETDRQAAMRAARAQKMRDGKARKKAEREAQAEKAA